MFRPSAALGDESGNADAKRWLGACWFGRKPDSPRLYRRLQLEQQKELISQAPWVSAIVWINATLILAVFFRIAPLSQGLIWYGLIAAIAMMHLYGWLRLRGRPDPKTVTGNTLRKSGFWSAILGGLWGMTPLIFFTPDMLHYQFFVVAVIGGMMAGVGSILHPVPQIVNGFLLTAVIPIIVFFATRDSVLHQVTAFMLLVYLVALMVMARRSYNRFAELVVTHDKAEAANRAKSDFLATMSHEIRTPLNGILGMLDLLMEEDLHPRQQDLADTARRSSRSLMRVINDILDFSKMEAGRLNIHGEAMTLDGLLDDLLPLVEPAARQKGLNIRVERAPDAPNAFVGDPLRLQQVLLNLLGNAVKFTDEGTISLAVRRTDAEAGDRPVRLSQSPDDQPGEPGPASDVLVFTVTDTGIGIPQDKLGELFRRFTQVDSSRARRHEGTGLGLAICRELVSRMGGVIFATSEDGKGSTFTVTLPVQACEAPKPSVAPEASAPVPLSILVAEDNDVSAKLMGRLLRADGHRVTRAENGRVAVDLITAGGHQESAEGTTGTPDTRFDLVLMDGRMPEMDGISACRAIRDAGYDLPIVALTADTDDNQAEAFLEAGMQAVLTKPVDRHMIRKTLAQFSAGPKTTPPPETGAPPPAGNTDALDSLLDRI
ncbi:ATP-binding protein [Yunchengibacter salinarum]|uniref:ATP-binding protein n=1 Tax=Yunchengibacter salinarum TaxID=3133399 RepID=UPI0035B5DD02